MKAALTRMRSALGRRKFLATAGAFAALALSIAAFAGGGALAQNAADCARLQQAIASRHASSGGRASARRARAHDRFGPLAWLRQPQVLVPRLGPAGAVRRNQRTDRAHAGQSGRPAGARRRRRSRGALQRGMPQRAGKAQQYLRGVVRRRREARVRSSVATADGREGRTARPRRRLAERIRGEERRQRAFRFVRWFACALAMAASSPFPIRGSGAAPTAWRRFAGPCAPTPTWRSTRSRSAERSSRPRRRPASPMPICPTRANSSKPTTPAAPAGARGKAGRRRSPMRRQGTATRSTTSW